jgi:hypothetical protein
MRNVGIVEDLAFLEEHPGGRLLPVWADMRGLDFR